MDAFPRCLRTGRRLREIYGHHCIHAECVQCTTRFKRCTLPCPCCGCLSRPTACSTLVLAVIGSRKGLTAAQQSTPHFLCSAFCQLLYQLSFTFSLLLTDAAKALLLISLAPMWAAVFGLVALGERLPCRTVVAMAISLCGVLLVFAPRFMGIDDAVTKGGSHERTDSAGPAAQVTPTYDSLEGDLLALATGIAQGLSLTVSRHAALHSPGADLTLATALSSLIAAVVALELPCYDVAPTASVTSNFWACTPPVWRSPIFFLLAVCDALAVALLYTSMLIAPRFITGGEVALIMLADDVLEPLWVFLRFGDVPSMWTVAGGVVLLSTLAVHEWVGARAQRRQIDATGEIPYLSIDLIQQNASPSTARTAC